MLRRQLWQCTLSLKYGEAFVGGEGGGGGGVVQRVVRDYMELVFQKALRRVGYSFTFCKILCGRQPMNLIMA